MLQGCGSMLGSVFLYLHLVMSISEDEGEYDIGRVINARVEAKLLDIHCMFTSEFIAISAR
jgi:hypothetical protein